MEKETFSLLLKKASTFARIAGMNYVMDFLPVSFRYYLNISSAYENLKETEFTYPEKSMAQREYLGPKTKEEIVEHLWVDGKIPVWIDVFVYRTDSEFTFIDLEACNRFSENEELYYYRDRDLGPFGVKSPIFPPEYHEDEGKFSLMERVERFGHLRKEVG